MPRWRLLLPVKGSQWNGRELRSVTARAAAQFMAVPNYPVVVVPPPSAQGIVMPKPPKPASPKPFPMDAQSPQEGS